MYSVSGEETDGFFDDGFSAGWASHRSLEKEFYDRSFFAQVVMLATTTKTNRTKATWTTTTSIKDADNNIEDKDNDNWSMSGSDMPSALGLVFI